MKSNKFVTKELDLDMLNSTPKNPDLYKNRMRNSYTDNSIIDRQEKSKKYYSVCESSSVNDINRDPLPNHVAVSSSNMIAQDNGLHPVQERVISTKSDSNNNRGSKDSSCERF